MTFDELISSKFKPDTAFHLRRPSWPKDAYVEIRFINGIRALSTNGKAIDDHDIIANDWEIVL